MGCGSSTIAPNKPPADAECRDDVTTRRIPDGATPATPRSQQGSQSPNKGLVYKDAVDNSSNLFAAIKRGDVTLAKDLIARSGAEVNNLIGMWGSTPLIVALQYGQKELAEILLALENPGNINHINEKGATALIFASMEGMTDMVKLLIEKGATISTEPTSEAIYNSTADQSVQCTALSIAVTNGHQSTVAALIEAGADINTRFAFRTVRGISKVSPSVSKTSSTSAITTTPAAGGEGAPDGAPELPPAATAAPTAAQPLVDIGGRDLTPILLACANGRLNVVRELLWRLCDCSLADAEGSTVLHHVARSKQDAELMYREIKKHAPSEVMDTLMAAMDCNGDTPLLVACDSKQTELVRLLLEDGSSASTYNPTTLMTPLHVAVRRRNVELVRLLLEYGADPLMPDKNKTTAFDAAMKLHQDSEIHKAMLAAATAWRKIRAAGAVSPAKNVDISITSYYNKTPDKDRVRDFSVMTELTQLNSAPGPVLYNNFALPGPSSPLQQKLAQAGYMEEQTTLPIDTVKAFAPASPVSQSSPREPLVRLDTVDQKALSSAVTSALQTAVSPYGESEDVSQLPYEAKQHRVSLLMVDGILEGGDRGDGEGDEGTPLSSAAALARLQQGQEQGLDSPVRVPHHTPVAHAPPTGQSGKLLRSTFFGGSAAGAGAGAGMLPGDSGKLQGSPHSSSPEITGSAAVARASGVYRTQGSFKAANLGAILPNKHRDLSPAVKASAAGAGAEGNVGGGEGGSETAGEGQGGQGAGQTPQLRPQLSTRKSFKAPELTPSGSFKSPYTVGLPGSSVKAGRKSVIVAGGGGASAAPTSETVAGASVNASAVGSANVSGYATPVKKHPEDGSGDGISSAATAVVPTRAESPDIDAVRPAEITDAALNTSADFGTPAKMSTTQAMDTLVTPVRKGGGNSLASTANSGFGASGTITGASTTMKSSLNAQNGMNSLVTPTKPSASGSTATMESKSAFAPRRPNNAPTNTAATGSALRSSRYGALQKEKSGIRAAGSGMNGATAAAAAVESAAAGPTTPSAQPVANGHEVGNALGDRATNAETMNTPTAATAALTATNATVTTTSTSSAAMAATTTIAGTPASGKNGSTKATVGASPAPPAVKEGSSAFKRNSFVRKASSNTPSK